MKTMLLLTASLLMFASSTAYSVTNRVIAAGTRHSIALLTDGTVKGWGSQVNGRLGNAATTGDALVPTNAIYSGGALLTDVADISGGDAYSLALLSNGTVRAWGKNTSYELGTNFGGGYSTVIKTMDITNVTAIAAGFNTALALSNGYVFAWGDNAYGKLGNGTTGGQTGNPLQVSDLANVTVIEAGNSHNLAVSNGFVYAWGLGDSGELGNGVSGAGYASNVPVLVSNLSGVTAVAAGAAHSLAISNGYVYAWGKNTEGRLGDDTQTTRTTPVAVLLGTPTSVTISSTNFSECGYYYCVTVATNCEHVVQVAAGQGHSLALTSKGTVWAWGNNAQGQLGDGTTTSRKTPVQVMISAGNTLSNVVAIAAGSDSNSSMALLDDGTILTWGSNSNGQLGDNTTTASSYPVTVLFQ